MESAKAESWKAGKPGKPESQAESGKLKISEGRIRILLLFLIVPGTQLKRTKAFWHSASVTSQTNTACKKYPEKK